MTDVPTDYYRGSSRQSTAWQSSDYYDYPMSSDSSRYASPIHIKQRYNPLQRYAYPAMALGGAALAGATYLGYRRMWKNKAPDPTPTPTPRPIRAGSWNITRWKDPPEKMKWH